MLNKPVGQALQIFVLGFILLTIAAGGFYWMTLESSITEESLFPSSLAIVICMAGAVGGVANNYRRFQKLNLQDWENTDAQSRGLMTIQIYQSPIIGALFAFVLYGVFASGLLQGALFPNFTDSEPFKNLVEFAKTVIPATNADAAKAVFWAFVAGFAEGFVPNFIDKVAKEADQAHLDNSAE